MTSRSAFLHCYCCTAEYLSFISFIVFFTLLLFVYHVCIPLYEITNDWKKQSLYTHQGKTGKQTKKVFEIAQMTIKVVNFFIFLYWRGVLIAFACMFLINLNAAITKQKR